MPISSNQRMNGRSHIEVTCNLDKYVSKRYRISFEVAVSAKRNIKQGSGVSLNAYGDEWLGNESVGKREDKISAFPTGNQAVPIS